MAALSHLGPYRLIAVAAEGGTARVWRGVGQDGATVAVKVVNPSVCHDRDALAKYFEICAALKTVSCPAVARVLDWGQDGGSSYVVTEWVDGRELGDILIDFGRMPAAQVVTLGAQICDGLAAAHAVGVVHQDLTPSNVMVTDQGAVKLLDFGSHLLRPLEACAQDDELAALGGAPEYWSPERCRGEAVGPAADVYCVGVILYELLCGKPPFGSHSYTDLANQHARQEVTRLALPTSAVQPPEALTTTVLRALAKSPAARHGSAAQLAAALRAVVLDSQESGAAKVRASRPVAPPAVTRPSARRWRAPMAMAMLGFVLAAVAGWWRAPWDAWGSEADVSVAAPVGDETTVVHVTSEPPGAAVFLASGSPVLGATPADIALPRSLQHAALLIRFPMTGEESRVDVRLDRAVHVHVMAMQAQKPGVGLAGGRLASERSAP